MNEIGILTGHQWIPWVQIHRNRILNKLSTSVKCRGTQKLYFYDSHFETLKVGAIRESEQI